MNENTPTFHRNMMHGEAVNLLHSLTAMIGEIPLHTNVFGAARAVISALDGAYAPERALEPADTVRVYLSEGEKEACEQAERDYPH